MLFFCTFRLGRAKPKDGKGSGGESGSEGGSDDDDDGDKKKKAKGGKGKPGGGGGQGGTKAAPHYGPWISNGQLQVGEGPKVYHES